MPQIIVTAGGAAGQDGTITLCERINTSDFESDRFAANLLERLGWAVSDAAEAEEQSSDWEEREVEQERHEPREPRRGDRELVEA